MISGNTVEACSTNTSSKNENESSDSSDDLETEQRPVRGKPKSGRIWKQRKKRFSSVIKTPGLRLSKEKKDRLRLELKRVKELSRAVKEDKRRAAEEKKLRTQANLKQKEENRRKSEIVQVIKNTAKLKRTKRKHLRNIEKRDTNPVQ